MIYFQNIFFLYLLKCVTPISLSEVLAVFGHKNCVAGSLLSFNQDSDAENDVIHSKHDFLENIGYSDAEKSAMSSVNEIAQYNEISYSYELIKEEGPAHSKMFTVTLYLGDEQYTSEMKSIKKAQQSSANMALKSTKYEHPQVKIKENEKALTPTVLLNNLAAKLGLAVTYSLVTDDLLEELSNQNDEIDFTTKKLYFQKLNETVHSNDTIHIRKDGGNVKGPFTVRVDVNGVKFVGEAHTIKNAKHEAAFKALKNLKNNEDAFYCLKEDDNCKSKKQNIKSPVSLVYEAAQKRNLGVMFEVIDEVGPSHKKLFTTKCSVGDLEATGEGKSKKESKRAAAENILPHLMEAPEVNSPSKNPVPTSKKAKKRNKRDKVIKSTFDKLDRMFDNVVDFGKGLVDAIRGNEDSNDRGSKPKKNKDGKPHRSPTDELLQLGNLLNLEIQYNDFVENEKSYSVLELGTRPSFICVGEGVNQKNSRDLASKYGINILYNLGLLDNLLDKSMKISNVLEKEEAFQKFWLEVVENDKSNDKLI